MFNQVWDAVGSDPEDNQPEGQGDCEEGGQAIGRDMVRSLSRGGAWRVSNESRDILKGEVVG